MREILFRGKRTDTGEWVEGFYTLYANNRGVHPCILTGTEQGCVIPAFVNPETVGQYTGLTDANGKRIFEGDIISLRDEFAVVKYSENEGAFVYLDFGEEELLSILRCWWKDGNVLEKVVGNRFDNPELLTAERSNNEN